MKAAVIFEPGKTPAYADFSDPAGRAGEAVVTMRAAAISHLARTRASGSHYSAAGAFPRVAGVDGVGRLADGQRVYVALPRPPHGTMAERTVVAAAHCIPLPDDLDDIAAAALANPGMSSWAALTARARLVPGETVLINGATGVSGRLAVGIARHLGAGRVIATGRNAAALAALDADGTILLGGEPGVAEAGFAEAIERGVDVVLDYLWGESARTLLMAAAKGTKDGVPLRFVQIGAMTGPEIALPAAVLRSAAIALMGSGLGSVGQQTLLASVRDLLHSAGAARLGVEARAVPLSDIAEAWADDDSRVRTVVTIG